MRGETKCRSKYQTPATRHIRRPAAPLNHVMVLFIAMGVFNCFAGCSHTRSCFLPRLLPVARMICLALYLLVLIADSYTLS